MDYSPLNRFGSDPELCIETHRTLIEPSTGEYALVELRVLWGEGPPEPPGLIGPDTFSIIQAIDVLTGQDYWPLLSEAQRDALEYEVWTIHRYEADQFYLEMDPWPEHAPAYVARDYP